jgi:HEAT repeat protein
MPVAETAPAASTPAAEPPATAEKPAAPSPPRRLPRLSRRLRAALAGAAVLLLAAGALAFSFRTQPTLTSAPDEELSETAEVAVPAGDADEADDLLAALLPGEEEWLDERPLPDGPEDPAQPVVGPPPGIDIPKVPAEGAAAAPPLPAPGSLAKFRRRHALSEEELRKQLAQAPEVGLERSLMSSLVWEYKAQQEESLATYGEPDLEPRPLYDLYPGVKGLAMRHGREAQLDPRRAATLDALSRKLRVYVANLAPADHDGKRPGAVRLRQVMYAEMRGAKPEWLRPEAIPVLMQMMTHEDVILRHLLLEILAEIKHRTATVALAQRAVTDLDADLRGFAIEALKSRPRDDYREALLKALRHPLPLMADHAAEALVALDVKEAVPALVTMLTQPDPAAPYVNREGRLLVREVVRTNHLGNCLLCHPPSVTYRDPVPGVIPNARWQYPVLQSQAQTTTNFVNSLTSRTTSTGTTKQTGCHDYTALAGLLNNVTIPSTPPSPGSKPPATKTPSTNSAKSASPSKASVAGAPNTGTSRVVSGSGGSGRATAGPVTGMGAVGGRTPGAAGGSSATGAVVRSSGGNSSSRSLSSVSPARPATRRSSRGGGAPSLPVPVRANPNAPQPAVTVINLPVLVRGDVTYLRQDFSVQQPVLDAAAPRPTFVNMRFDYFVRVRRATPEEIKAAQTVSPDQTYEQREAVLFALRELTGQDAGATTAAWQQKYPDAPLDSQAERLAADVVRTKGTERVLALTRLRDGKGPLYTDALAAVNARLSGKEQEQAREVLVERLTRMTAATLRNKLTETNAEVRRAAALACAKKEDPGHVADLLACLDDPDEAVVRAAGEALRSLTGQDLSTAQQWKAWWEKQQDAD